ncbi:MAG: TlpA family protein disulfide reductase [Flavobacteriales bacterium]|mgnify:FL=1|jgi:cytochrome c biogenesis protein CcmG, thiol:disulfide interchange protein DsbE|nr:TlpA family protein disulfide reductase [Flavobacteriales bacterium]MBT5090560.1 TlpA family protein disulfide reductase [Flavobacteriales bacterium]MBT5750583.1 TlpA family protein disulfide reductase [Flavobacteriales bacterium]
MRKLLLTITAVAILSTLSIAQNRTLPSVDVKTLNGGSMNITAIENDGNPIVISFWATWCKPCKKELNTIAEVYEDWQDETGVKLIALSIDDTRTMTKVAPYVNASDWDYEVYLDPNGDLKRAMGVSTVPHTFLLNSKKEIVWQHKGYVDGDENELLEQIEKIAK